VLPWLDRVPVTSLLVQHPGQPVQLIAPTTQTGGTGSQSELIGKIRQLKEPVGVSAGKCPPEHSASQETPSPEHKQSPMPLMIQIMLEVPSAED
jgi:hypothetical protein